MFHIKWRMLMIRPVKLASSWQNTPKHINILILRISASTGFYNFHTWLLLRQKCNKQGWKFVHFLYSTGSNTDVTRSDLDHNAAPNTAVCHHSLGNSNWEKPGSFLSSQYVLLLTHVSSLFFLWTQEKSKTAVNGLLLNSPYLRIRWICCACLKNFGWCVRFFSSSSVRRALCSSSIFFFCSAAASRFPSSSSLPATCGHIHYADNHHQSTLDPQTFSSVELLKKDIETRFAWRENYGLT